MKNLCFIKIDKQTTVFFKVWKYHLYHRNGTIVVRDNLEIKKISKMLVKQILN